jgi:D-alanyl-D-alanine carboxypeptidase (penicillin-binding protein 5/6)
MYLVMQGIPAQLLKKKSKNMLKLKIRLSVMILFVTFSSVDFAFAKQQTKPKQSCPVPIQTGLVVDAKTGKVLHAQNAKAEIYPASLTKVMTLYMIFESLESGKLTLDQKVPVSKYATEARPCKLYLKAGETISVRDIILALIVKSANDAARVAAEAVAGSEQKFGKLMTVRARQLGMKNTTFTNASGWHDPAQKTTPIDLAKLSIAVKRDFPQYYGFFSKTSYVFRGKTIHGHNPVTANYPGAEGLKTGFTGPAGRNLITTATRGGQSLVGVVTGSPSSAVRDRKMINLLDEQFGVPKQSMANYKTTPKTTLVSYKKKIKKGR